MSIVVKFHPILRIVNSARRIDRLDESNDALLSAPFLADESIRRLVFFLIFKSIQSARMFHYSKPASAHSAKFKYERFVAGMMEGVPHVLPELFTESVKGKSSSGRETSLRVIAYPKLNAVRSLAEIMEPDVIIDLPRSLIFAIMLAANWSKSPVDLKDVLYAAENTEIVFGDDKEPTRRFYPSGFYITKLYSGLTYHSTRKEKEFKEFFIAPEHAKDYLDHAFLSRMDDSMICDLRAHNGNSAIRLIEKKLAEKEEKKKADALRAKQIEDSLYRCKPRDTYGQHRQPNCRSIKNCPHLLPMIRVDVDPESKERRIEIYPRLQCTTLFHLLLSTHNVVIPRTLFLALMMIKDRGYAVNISDILYTTGDATCYDKIYPAGEFYIARYMPERLKSDTYYRVPWGNPRLPKINSQQRVDMEIYLNEVFRSFMDNQMIEDLNRHSFAQEFLREEISKPGRMRIEDHLSACRHSCTNPTLNEHDVSCRFATEVFPVCYGKVFLAIYKSRLKAEEVLATLSNCAVTTVQDEEIPVTVAIVTYPEMVGLGGWSLCFALPVADYSEAVSVATSLDLPIPDNQFEHQLPRPAIVVDEHKKISKPIISKVEYGWKLKLDEMFMQNPNRGVVWVVGRYGQCGRKSYISTRQNGYSIGNDEPDHIRKLVIMHRNTATVLVFANYYPIWLPPSATLGFISEDKSRIAFV